MTVKMPYQCFINGQFIDAEDGKTYDSINPTDGSVSKTCNEHCVFALVCPHFLKQGLLSGGTYTVFLYQWHAEVV